MSFRLSVHQPFALKGGPTFQKGEIISDETLIEQILGSEQSNHVVKIPPGPYHTVLNEPVAESQPHPGEEE